MDDLGGKPTIFGNIHIASSNPPRSTRSVVPPDGKEEPLEPGSETKHRKKKRWFPRVLEICKLIQLFNFLNLLSSLSPETSCFKRLHKIQDQNRRERSFSVSWPRRVWNLWTFNAKKKLSSQTFCRNLKWLDMSGKTLESICTNVSPAWNDPNEPIH